MPKAVPLRVHVFERSVIARARGLIAVEPAKPFMAFACKGKPDAVKVVGSAYGSTELEARKALDIKLELRKR